MTMALLYLAIFGAAFVLTMVGLGGGLIYAPLFVLLGFPVSTAVPASLFLNGIAAFSAALTYYRKGMVDVKTAIPLLISSTLAAPLGAVLTNHIDRHLFSGIMALVIILAALRMLFSGKPEGQKQLKSTTVKILGGSAIGLIVGLMGGLLGIGGGVFIVPLLIYMLRMSTKAAAATSIFIVVFPSFSGFIAHLSLAATDCTFILLAGIFSFAGGQLGSRFMSEKLKGRAVKRIFGGVLLLFALKLLQKAFL